MSKQSSNSCTRKNHHLTFTIADTTVSVDQMGQWVAEIIRFDSEAEQEAFGRDAACKIFSNFAKEVALVSAAAEHARVRRLWIAECPPNHAGYYYCHIGGEWVHIDVMELDHVVPGSVERIDTTKPGWQKKLRPACHPHNYQKGSSIVKSATLEIRPPDEEC